MDKHTRDYSKIPCIVEKDKIVADVNEEFLSFTGYTPEELLGKTLEYVWNELLLISIAPTFTEDLAEAFLFSKELEAKNVFIEKKPMHCAGGTSYYIWDNPASSLYLKYPYIDHQFSNGRAGVAMYSVPDFILVKANQSYINFLQEPFNNKENCIGRNIYTIVPAFSGSHFDELFMELTKTGKVLEVKEESFKGQKKGTTYWDTTAIPVFENDNIKFIFQVSHESTEAVQNKLLLSAQNKKISAQKMQLEAIIENMSDSLCIFDKNDKYILLNKAAREMLFPYFSQMDKVGDGHRQSDNYDYEGNIIPYEKIPANRVKNGERFTCMRMKSSRNGRTMFMEVSGTPLYDDEGNFNLGIICSRDVTDLVMQEKLILDQKEKLLEAEVQSRKDLEEVMKMKDEFIYNITHELRTPSAVVSSALQAIDLMYKKEVTPHVRKHLSTIKQNTNRQLRLINNLLDITKMSSGNIKLNKTTVDIVYLTKAIVDSVDVYAAQKRIRLQFNSEISTKEIYLDEEKYERILLNLLSNAVKFTQEDKNINVQLSIKKKKRSSFVCVDVIDSGIGIPKNKRHLVFERFAQIDNSLSCQAEGTGLGLSLVKLLVEAMDGEITFKSEVGDGTTFTVLLPLEKPTAVQSPATCNEPENRFMNDDSRILRAASIEFSDIYFS